MFVAIRGMGVSPMFGTHTGGTPVPQNKCDKTNVTPIY